MAKSKDKSEIVFEQKDIDENKLISAIGYIGILCLLPLLLKKESAFAKFHGKQGLVLFILEVITAIFIWIPPFIWIINILLIVGSIYGLLNAYEGKAYKLPIIFDLSEKIKL